MPGGIPDVAQDDLVILDSEAFVEIGTAKGATVMGTTEGHLQKDAVRLTGRPDARPLVMHAFLFGNDLHQ